MNRVVVQGSTGSRSLSPASDTAYLRGGPVHYGVTPLPGAGEPFAVAGHRTTYSAPFYSLNVLRRGDTIVVDTPYGRFVYSGRQDHHRAADRRKGARRPRLRPRAHHLHAALQRQPPPGRLGEREELHAEELGAQRSRASLSGDDAVDRGTRSARQAG